jgi:ribosomal-protein-alanine N-acetyltransferase
VVRMIVGGESSKTENQIYYAKHPEVQERRKDWWVTHPIHPMGPHDGLPDMLRLKQSALTTARLELEPIQLSHAKELWELFSDLRLHEFVPTEPPTLEAQQQRCMRWSRGRSPDGAEIWINWAARDKMSGSLIGHFQVGIKTDGTATIGYTVANHFQGKGYATEALRGVFDLLQDKFQVIKINASADTRNLASHRLAEKLGMKKVATIKGADFFKGKASDEYVFSLDVKNE